MHKKITCVDYEDFMAHFVPHEPGTVVPPSDDCGRNLRSRFIPRYEPNFDSPPSRNPFASLRKPRSEKDMYGMVTAALNHALLCPEYLFVSTPHNGVSVDKASKQAVDCGMYPAHVAPKLEKSPEGNGSVSTDWSWVDIAVVCRMAPVEDDPFDETLKHHHRDADTRRKVLGHILSDAQHIFNRQQRTCLFVILFLGDFARIVRIDRAGLFATHKVDYRADGVKLAQFLWHYSRLPAATRGHDTTAVRLHPESADAQKMKDRVKDVTKDDYVGNAFKESLDPEWPWWKLEVPNETSPGTSRYFLVGKPNFQADDAISRTTRGYVAIESEGSSGDRLVYLKDTWRVVNDNIRKEGVVLETLGAKRVKFVPTLLCHGDIRGQESTSQTLWPKYHPGEESTLKTHQHYRLVVNEVGKPLNQVETGSQLVFALWCCIKAHEQAYEAGILHCDISVGNILLHLGEHGRWHGLLNDWELSKTIEQQATEKRPPLRMGTWEFMSVNALNDHEKAITIQDELESFFHVLLYMALHLLPHNCDATGLPYLLHGYFDSFDCYAYDRSKPKCGATKEGIMHIGYISLAQYNELNGRPPPRLCFLERRKADEVDGPAYCHPIDDVITTLLKWFSAYYELPYKRSGAAQAARALQAPKIVRAPSDSADLANFRKMFARAKARAEARRMKTGAAPAPSSSTSVPPPTSAEDRLSSLQREVKIFEAIADNLKSHKAVLDLLEESLEQAWPDDDCRSAAQPEKECAPHASQASGAPPVSPSKRRNSEAVEDDAGTPSKRRKL
ncbi:hypothetical protein BV20DRAFT_1056338 [Pilatotrama ljubarskyi]|nr:hypothetical protein BV20DRAFT_1056338 [Pilatotrama ljubarskyi]